MSEALQARPVLVMGRDALAEMVDEIMGGGRSSIMRFQYGTCHGQIIDKEDEFSLLTVVNDSPGNGQFVLLIEHLEKQAQKTNRPFAVREIFNPGLRYWLQQRGYELEGCNAMLTARNNTVEGEG